jgi:hypothetical protein
VITEVVMIRVLLKMWIVTATLRRSRMEMRNKN